MQARIRVSGRKSLELCSAILLEAEDHRLSVQSNEGKASYYLRGRMCPRLRAHSVEPCCRHRQLASSLELSVLSKIIQPVSAIQRYPVWKAGRRSSLRTLYIVSINQRDQRSRNSKALRGPYRRRSYEPQRHCPSAGDLDKYLDYRPHSFDSGSTRHSRTRQSARWDSVSGD